MSAQTLKKKQVDSEQAKYYLWTDGIGGGTLFQWGIYTKSLAEKHAKKHGYKIVHEKYRHTYNGSNESGYKKTVNTDTKEIR